MIAGRYAVDPVSLLCDRLCGFPFFAARAHDPTGNPSQYELACTSDGWRADASKLVLAFVTVSCLWFATI